MVALDVADRGRGIANDELQHVTRKFFRGRRTGSTGSGLGLAIVKRIVNDHGGRLAIESSVNGGTTVTISVPPCEDDEATDSGR